uniref:Sulfotransferase n=1 Tax=Salarias fasciatus TaxID=181472 RepID=A0A672INZ1_SALFA
MQMIQCMDAILRPKLFDFHGVSMTKFFTENWENIQNFQARPDDILIATYPKAGTTWVSNILDLLYFGQREKPIPIYERVPFLEIFHSAMGSERMRSTLPAMQKTMLSATFRDSSKERVCITYEHEVNVTKRHVDITHCLLATLMYHSVVSVVFGSWYDHVSNWWKKKQTYSNLHYMFFEDMVEDTGREIDKLCSFLGLTPSVEEKTRIVGEVHFDKMKKDDMANYSTVPVLNFKISPFMRKGMIVGDWKNHFTVAQNEEFDEDYKTKMKDPTLQFRSKI